MNAFNQHYSPEQLRKAVEIVNNYEWLANQVGVQPTIQNFKDTMEKALEELQGKLEEVE